MHKQSQTSDPRDGHSCALCRGSLFIHSTWIPLETWNRTATPCNTARLSANWPCPAGLEENILSLKVFILLLQLYRIDSSLLMLSKASGWEERTRTTQNDVCDVSFRIPLWFYTLLFQHVIVAPWVFYVNLGCSYVAFSVVTILTANLC